MKCHGAQDNTAKGLQLHVFAFFVLNALERRRQRFVIHGGTAALSKESSSNHRLRTRNSVTRLGHCDVALGHCGVALGHCGVALGHFGVALGHCGIALGHCGVAYKQTRKCLYVGL